MLRSRSRKDFHELLIRAIGECWLIVYTLKDETLPRLAEPHVYGKIANVATLLVYDLHPRANGDHWNATALQTIDDLEFLPGRKFRKRRLPEAYDPDLQATADPGPRNARRRAMA